MADEVMPKPEASPSDWIRESLGEKWLIATHAERRQEYLLRQEISPGEAMNFIYAERREPLTISIEENGNFSIVSGDEGDANWFWSNDDPDACGDSLAELAREIAYSGIAGLYDISCRYWSEAIPFRLTATASGLNFEYIGPEEASV